MVGNFGNAIFRKYGRRGRTKAAGEAALVGVAAQTVPVGILHDCIESVSPSSLGGTGGGTEKKQCITLKLVLL